METRARYVLIGLFTLAVIAGGFAFVYWLQAFGGFAEKAVYRIRFEGSVAGLLIGGPVLFNGIRVGEVTDLQLDAGNPRQVTATIAVDPQTRVHRDTRVGIETQGLLSGSSAIVLYGGTPESPLVVSRRDDVPLLVAAEDAGQSMTEAARIALRRLDTLLSDNSQSLHDTIENLKTFTQALARNSDRVDGILAGLERMTGATSRPAPGYDLTAPRMFSALTKVPQSQLVVNDPSGVVAFDTQKILVRAGSGERTPMDNAQWADSTPKLFQEKIIQSFENAGYAKVGRPTDGLTADFQLILDIRSFEIGPGPEGAVAEVEFSAKLLREGGRIVTAKIFQAAMPASASDPHVAAAALDKAFGRAVTELVVWAAAAM